MSWFTFTWQNFLFSFLALAFEGLPFVLLGSLISGGIAVFVPSKIITGLLPRNGVLATLVSGLLGLCFPVCECGIVPVVRRLINKGLPVSMWSHLHAGSPDRKSDRGVQHIRGFPGSVAMVTCGRALSLATLSRSQPG
jgi:uncharacterized protein